MNGTGAGRWKLLGLGIVGAVILGAALADFGPAPEDLPARTDPAAERITAFREQTALDQVEGRWGRARSRYRELATTLSPDSEPELLAAALRELGRLEAQLGNFDEAIGTLEDAVELCRRTDSPALQSIRVELAWVHHLRRESATAAEILRSVLEAVPEDDPKHRAAIHDRLGSVLRDDLDLGERRFAEARFHYEETFRLCDQLGDCGSADLAHTRVNLAELELAAGHPREALDLLDPALAVLDPNDGSWPLPSVHALSLRARAHAEEKNYRAAFEDGDRLLDRIEELWQTLDPDTAIRFWAVRQTYVRDHVDRLFAAHAEQPGAGWLERALVAIERGRARSLLSLLQEPGRHTTSTSAHSIEQVRERLDEQTEILVLHEGTERWHGLRVGRALLEHHDLGEASALGKQVGFGLARLKRSHAAEGSAWSTSARALGEALAPLFGDQKEGHRWIVMADGALEELPLGALISPRDGKPLVHRWSFARLPSFGVLSTLLEARQRRVSGFGAGPEPMPEIVAFVDPVFGADDPRIVARASNRRQSPVPELERLDGTREEAARILDRVPADRVRILDGFDAHREAFLGLVQGRAGGVAGRERRVPGPRIVHVATHTAPDPSDRSRIGLIFSRFDPRGRARPGWVGVDDLAIAESSAADPVAELVVLAGCRSAEGPVLSGEGRLGLPRSLLLAGASGVIATAWPVDDAATAHWTGVFYDVLIVQGLAVDRAVRAAQLELLDDPRWQAPYYWAPFELHGLGTEPFSADGTLDGKGQPLHIAANNPQRSQRAPDIRRRSP